jgi:two-component system cell cycle response regulator
VLGIGVRQTPLAARVLLGAAAIGLTAHGLHTAFGLGGSRLDSVFDDWIYNGVMVASACACLIRGMAVRTERAAWLFIGAGLASWSTGEIYWTLYLSKLDTIPYPSIADGFYLGLYPALYVGIVLLVRSRVPRFSASVWLDGAIGGLTVAAFGVAVLYPAILDGTSGSGAAVATNLTYPLGDILLLSFVAGIAAVTGWRPGRAWVLVGLGLATASVADSVYLYQESTSAYTEGTILDTLWLAGPFLLALAAWRSDQYRVIRLEGLRILVAPAVFALGSLGLLFLGEFHPLHRVALAFATAALLLVVIRKVQTFSENLKLLATASKDALTDSVTGLGNRRKLLLDLSLQVREATPESPQMFAMFDLNGFKSYNDTFGHPAGDLLLRRLGHDLGSAIQPHGTAYRLGGDEFCILASTVKIKPESLAAAAHAALTVNDDEFSIGSACGTVAIPVEAKTASQALMLADARMYAQKGRRPADTGATREPLVRIA